ncbi:HD domain-containing phosphohydrolase [Candidatus Accumulibacter sp. ACC003]|uniref:HD-GYP domain-containing protein n=1 Tax=Candidatus Accumulibacter sp. ACC003 TaxID=2823334 RepID=UPI0025BA904F|nr:HD domain-containing phosphohydrolase [Candidatus Accumulibacter sp. ACC003]
MRSGFLRIDLPPPIAFRLTVARDCRSAVFEHSVQVMLVALFLGIRQQLAAGKLRALAAAALLHDLGVLHIDPEIFLAGHIFTAAERRQLHAHPLTAGMIVQQQPEYPPTVARAILEHHERHDGSGYPRGLKGDEISVEGRILLLAELVAALLEKNAREPDKQLSVILRLNHSKFDQAMTTQILKLLEQEHAVADEADLQPEQPQAERLKRLAGECDKWRQLRSQLENYTTDAPAIGEFLADRVAVLERSLADAGLHPDQIASVGIGLRDQPAAVSELAMLMHETSWQLKAIVDDVFARFPTLETTDKPGERAICDWLRQLQAGLSAGEGAGPGDAALP